MFLTKFRFLIISICSFLIASATIHFTYAKNRRDNANPSMHEVVRFVTEGRANLKGIKLANGHDATLTIAALCELSGTTWHESPRFQVIADDGSPAANPTESVQRLVVIPSEMRGSLKIRFETTDPAIHHSVTQASSFLAGVVSSRWLPTSEIRVAALETGRDRSYATGLGRNASIHLQPGVIDVPTAIHELAHHIEGDHPIILEFSKRFISRRSRGGAPERLLDLTGEHYEPHEITLSANWSTRGGSHYVGKFYGPSLRQSVATELISMGLERIYNQPDTFFREDSDYFLFLLLTLQSA